VSSFSLRDDGDIHSTIKQRVTKIDSIYITFHPNDNSKDVYIQPFIDNFKITAEDTVDLTYSAGRIVMRTWYDLVQYQMLSDALKFNSNSMVRLSREFINLL
jgi:hypothetical protein